MNAENPGGARPGIGIATLAILLAACTTPASTEISGLTSASPAIEAFEHGNLNDLFTDAANGADWPSYGRLYDEQHYSPLTQIDSANVGGLGLVWSLDLPATLSPMTAPLAVDGKIYLSYGKSVLYAVDAVTGQVLWTYDPRVTDVAGDELRNGWNIRGLAYWDGMIITGTIDGRLIGVDSVTGELKWSQQTFPPGSQRFISGPPRVFDGKVIIGHGGSDVGQFRGYVTAYDATNGEQLWRFWIVPGNPSDGFENAAMEMAARTWTGEWWRYGGGGAAWNAMTYDPEFDRVYIGTGNGMPWNQKIRSPEGGDNLFLSSVLALDADTGEYAWHYQTTPGETWDFNSAMDMTLAELDIEGERRKVILHAPKNGFHYVIDRVDGTLISAEKIGVVNWASHIDLETGRPVENPEARYPEGRATVFPYPGGVHNRQAMSFNRQTGLLYIPTVDAAGVYDDTAIDLENWQPQGRGAGNPGVIPGMDFNHPQGSGASLLAWDPVSQREVWRIRFDDKSSSDTMTTAGNLVFQGRSDGRFIAYDARTGQQLWEYDAGAAVSAMPITFERGGRQYVSVIAGYGGAIASLGQYSARHGWQYREQSRRLLTFALGGEAQLPPTRRSFAQPIADPEFELDDALWTSGMQLYGGSCSGCHGRDGIAGGAAPDLRASATSKSSQVFAQIVIQGLLLPNGMPRFDELHEAEVEAIRHYIQAQAQDDLRQVRGISNTF